MEKLKSLSVLLAFVLFAQFSAVAQSGNIADKLKKYVNTMVEKVETAEQPDRKREIMNEVFTDMIAIFERVERFKNLSESDKIAIAELKTDITVKKDELNGQNGFAEVRDGELNNFAQYVQQDLEQAERYVTISVSLLVLIGILLLLL